MTHCARIFAMMLSMSGVVIAQTSIKRRSPGQACDTAQSQMELNQCAGEQYKKADARLNTIYRNVLNMMEKDLADAKDHKDTDQVRYEQAAIDKLKAAEKAWIQYRDLHCEAARHQYEGGSMNPMVWGFCMEQVSLDRIEELKSAYEEGDRKLE